MLDSDSKELREKLRQLQGDGRAENETKKIKSQLTEWGSLDFEQKKLIAHTFIEKIMIGDGTIEIMYR